MKLLVDETNLPGEAVQVGAFRQAAGSVSVVHAHAHAEVFMVTSGELVNVLRDPAGHVVWKTVKPGVAGVVPAWHRVVHWVPAEAETAEGYIVWSGREAEHLKGVGFAHGAWQAPFGVDRRVRRADLPADLVRIVECPPEAHARLCL